MNLDLNVFKKQGDFILDVNINVHDSVVGLFGPSGAGKSTLLHLLSGLQKPQQGRIVLNNQTLCDIENHIYLPPEKRQIGVVFQDARLFPHMTVEKNIIFGMTSKMDEKFLNKIITTLEIHHFLKRNPLNLSGGEKQRVAIARALIRKPKLLLLDEPFSAIDVHMRTALLPFINRVRQEFNCPMLIISHDLPDLLCLTNSLIILKNGKIMGYGDCSDLAFNPQCSDLITHAGIYSTFDAKVVMIDKANGQIMLCTHTNGQMIKAPYKKGLARETKVKARLRPEDVVLAKGPADFITSQNQLKATIIRLHHFDDEILLELDAGFKILSGITYKAFKNFDITIGSEIWIFFKSLAVEYFLDC